jgi:Tfp pilus assembly protein PilO
MQYLFPFILFVVSILIYINVIEPLFGDVREERSRVAELDEALANSKRILDLRDTLLNKFNSIPNEQLSKLEILLPDEVTVTDLALEVRGIAKENSLELVRMAIIGSNRASTGSLGPRNQSRNYDDVDISLAVRGSYTALRNFLRSLEEGLRIYDVQSISFSATGSGVGDQTFTMTLRTYQFQHNE